MKPFSVFVSGLVPRIECLRFKLIVVDEVGYLDVDVFPVSFSTRIPSPCLTVDNVLTVDRTNLVFPALEART